MTALDNVLAAARSKVGGPYVWGGDGPVGFDCSGLMQWAYGTAGIHLPRTSQEQRDFGSPVASLAAALPGDLITFTYPEGPSNPGPGNHVGMYIGGGQIVEAANRRAGIRVGALDVAHVDRIRRIVGGGTTADGTQQAAITSATGGGGTTLQQAGYQADVHLTPWGLPLNPLKLPDWLAKQGQKAAGGAAGGIVSAIGPLVLSSAGVLAGLGLVVAGIVITVNGAAAGASQKDATETGQGGPGGPGAGGQTKGAGAATALAAL